LGFEFTGGGPEQEGVAAYFGYARGGMVGELSKVSGEGRTPADGFEVHF
jgi:hypothetical protein